MPVIVVNGDSDFDRKFSAGNGKAVFVDFTASWCGPCQYIAPIFSDLANQYKGSVFLKVDVDECRGTAATYGVNAMPTFIAFVNGQKKATIQGADESGLRSMVAKYASTSAAWSGTGQRLSGSTTGSSSSTSSSAPPRASGAAPPPAGPNPLEPVFRIIETINERLQGFGISGVNFAGFQLQPFHLLLAIALLIIFGPFGLLIALAVCFFTQPRGGGPAPGAPRAGGSGAGGAPRPPPPAGPRAFGGSGQRLGGN
ncbi:Thioredoxin domain-containing protein [Caenorhabditis elegans]|uniref:Thioredoxin domain-containing protein n=1 Tax=Caenorhabditis elegans TaxID=6239 RepID=Q9N357_CAEEL|nr:Thioredoxin domain-containing protein [Caenorhabditis elegans]CCD67239.1 Thioredoxin domain-containing protein [Caenorhabditis elegans]|eukprot:NP_500036.2 Uncharacterized protein CELE_Y55F3AR.2 [Caenorhabditis elegans]